jgi:hypothetical protein
MVLAGVVIYDCHADRLHDFCIGVLRDRAAAAECANVLCTAAALTLRRKDFGPYWGWARGGRIK